MAVGDIFSLGRMEQDYSNLEKPIEWQVLDVKDGKALVISRYGLFDAKYNYTKNDVTWENCSLRKNLNGLFLTKTFSKEEQELILETQVVNADNPVRGTEGGNDTTDRLFLLSLDEALVYFHMTKNERGGHTYATGDGCNCLPTERASAGGWYQNYDECYWWLRTAGDLGYDACVAIKDEIDAFGCCVDDYCIVVRPAMWIKLGN